MYRGELFNSITHLVGAVLALVGVTVMVTLAGVEGGALRIVSFSVYGATLFLLYLVSTLYHSLRGRAKRVFRVLDHNAIYLLIAGTYTPFTLIALEGTTGWWLFGVVWTLAAIGILLDSLPRTGERWWSIPIYLSMGWAIVFALKPLIAAIGSTGFWWLIAGGLFYTVGILFYVLDGRWPWCHGIWHLFVLAGSVSHYFAILLYL
ncbi:hemolysin III family protein [Rhodoferax sp. 4810]|uniref:Hemolysin III family protein n=1 Tax=Thiospirillum jenense TaxID=1653858 RepID=A0A839HLI4_9GAMM|nr:hemolysin III family protein [Thiospirillum jenense]MBB1078032.1 hemolysin III family protein [Rhodoferax jenense]MBB1127398.1 hemolysin III family protein [Thiospirillum jenense]